MTHYKGSCHCEAVRFEIDADPEEMTSCNCTLCVKKNAIMIRVKESQFRLVAGADVLATYVWNTGVARHHFCSRCGIYTFHRKRVAPDTFGVNVFCLEHFDPAALPLRRADGASRSLKK